MLYRFQSRETADLLMLQSVAERVLELLGKDASNAGIITWAEMPTAIQRLKTEAEREMQAPAEVLAKSESPASEQLNENAAETQTAVQFRQRIAPFIVALERCHSAQKDLIWAL